MSFRDFRNFLEGSGIFIIGNSGALWNIPRCPRMFQSIQGINNRGLFDEVDFTYRIEKLLVWLGGRLKAWEFCSNALCCYVVVFFQRS